MSYFLDNVDEIRNAINILEKSISEMDGDVLVNVDTLTGTGETGRAVMKATTPEKARDAIDAGTSSLKLGSTATTAMPGNTHIPDDVPDTRLVPEGGSSGQVLYQQGDVIKWASVLPSNGTLQELTDGTSTHSKKWSANVLADFVKAQIAAGA